MKKKLIVLALLVLAGLVAWKLWLAPSREGVAARYKEQEVTWKQVEQYRSVMSLLGDKGDQGDRAIVDRILQGYILAEEAKRLGVTVSESEVAERLKELPLPDGKTNLEDYLAQLGSGLQGALEPLQQQLRGQLTLERLKEALARDYCAEQGIDFKSDNIPAEVDRAVNAKLEALLDSHRAEIEYYF